MNKLWLAAIVVVAARMLSAQDDSSALLEQATEKILDSIRRIPKYTCLETIDRTYYVAPPEKKSPHLMTEVPANACTGTNPPGESALWLDAKDRLRVEVAYGGEDEIHSWPGASRFDTRPIDQMIPFGPMSTGAFGGYLLDVFANPGAEVKFFGKETYGSREVFKYSVRVPLEASHMNTKGVSGWKTTGFSGSFEIYAATSDLARLIVETDQLPPDTRMCHSKTTLDYQFMLIGDGEFLLPRRSELQTFDTDAGQTDSVTAFSACHEYTAESTIRFDDRDSSPKPAKSAPALTTVLPSGISLPLALLRPIDTRSAAAGDTVAAKVTRAIRAPDSKAILVPAGAIARGRILQMRYQYSTSRVLISVRFNTLEIQGVTSPLSVRLARDLKPVKPQNSRGLKTRAPEFSLPPPAPMETGSFLVFLTRSSTLVVPAGFQSKWITVAP